MYLFLQKHHHFSPFVCSVGGLLGMEVEAVLKRIVSCRIAKFRQTYYHMCIYINSRVTITMFPETLHCIRLYLVTAIWISIHKTQWWDGSIINLYRLKKGGKLKSKENTQT